MTTRTSAGVACRAWLLIAGVAVVAVALVGCGDRGLSSSGKTKLLNDALQAHVEGRLTAAQDGYLRVLHDDPHNKFAAYNLGLIAQTQGDAAKAERYYRQALAIDGRYEPALFNLAIVRAKAGASDEALALYRRAIAVRPDDAGAHLNLGLLLVSLGNTTVGEAEIRKAQELDPRIAASTTAPSGSSSTSTTRKR